MELVEQNYDQAIQNIIKVYLAQMNSAMKISKIMCEHSNENELTGDHVICGLIYRLMTPMTDEEMTQSINEAESILYAESSSEEEEEENENIINDIDDLSISRKIKCNSCNCEICMRCRICLSNFNDYIPKDNLGDLFKNSIHETCKTHNRIL